jgi:hypothetical protein
MAAFSILFLMILGIAIARAFREWREDPKLRSLSGSRPGTLPNEADPSMFNLTVVDSGSGDFSLGSSHHGHAGHLGHGDTSCHVSVDSGCHDGGQGFDGGGGHH